MRLIKSFLRVKTACAPVEDKSLSGKTSSFMIPAKKILHNPQTQCQSDASDWWGFLQLEK